MNYHHTQRAPHCLILYALAVTLLGVASLRNDSVLVWVFQATALLMLVLAPAADQSLKFGGVSDGADKVSDYSADPK